MVPPVTRQILPIILSFIGYPYWLDHSSPDLAGLVVLCHGDDDFSLSVSFFEVSDRIRDLIERVTPIDNGSYCASFKQFLNSCQIFFVWFRDSHVPHFLAPGS